MSKNIESHKILYISIRYNLYFSQASIADQPSGTYLGDIIDTKIQRKCKYFKHTFLIVGNTTNNVIIWVELEWKQGCEEKLSSVLLSIQYSHENNVCYVTETRQQDRCQNLTDHQWQLKYP